MGAFAVCSSSTCPRRITVLVVEDEILVRLSLAATLRDEGFFVIEAANGDEAVAVLASSTPIDIVLTDVNMPGSLDGVALSRYVRSTRPALKVIVVSGRVDQAVAAEVADAFVPKPYDPARILHAIGRLLSGAPE
jgi:CheY-like chemotaxis protein